MISGPLHLVIITPQESVQRALSQSPREFPVMLYNFSIVAFCVKMRHFNDAENQALPVVRLKQNLAGAYLQRVKIRIWIALIVMLIHRFFRLRSGVVIENHVTKI